MSNAESIYGQLDTVPPKEDLKALLRDYLAQQVERQRLHPEDRETVAYEIAGLLSTNFASSLEEDDPYLQVLDLAGSLELPEKHRGDVTWEQFERLVEALS